jgi:signal transduction histidine kinase
VTPDALHIARMKALELFDTKIARKQAEDQLQHTRKMEAIGQLTSGVAHDFNNLLTVIVGNLHLLRRRIDAGLDNYAPEEIEGKLKAIELASDRGTELVRRLMVFARQSPLSQEVVDLNDCLSDTLQLLRRTIGDNIEVTAVFKQDVWPVSIDVPEFQNMMINFAVNARDAMPKGGKLTIETDNVVLDESYTLQHPDVTSGPYALITISDTGTGMAPDVKQRIFEPFFTTKPLGQGTGLGMSMAYGFMRQSGGYIHVYSELGHGTVFRIYLPKFILKNDEEEQEEVQKALPVGRETVLVIEDQDDALTLAVDMLERLGYKTLQAKNGKVALELFKRGKIDLVFADLFISGDEGGVDIVRRMRAIEPTLKVLYTSGYSENALPDENAPQDEAIISKPFRREALAIKIRKILDSKGKHDVEKAYSGR